MNLTKIDLACLDAVADDYESLPMVTRGLRRLGFRDLSKHSVLENLRLLARRGLVTPYSLNAHASAFIQEQVDHIDADTWFLITDEGKACLLER